MYWKTAFCRTYLILVSNHTYNLTFGFDTKEFKIVYSWPLNACHGFPGAPPKEDKISLPAKSSFTLLDILRQKKITWQCNLLDFWLFSKTSYSIILFPVTDKITVLIFPEIFRIKIIRVIKCKESDLCCNFWLLRNEKRSHF